MSGVLKQIAVAAMESPLLKSKFRGCMLGSLIGDTLGSPYEGDEVSPGDKLMIQRSIDGLESPDLKGPVRGYTDDTAMTKSVAKGLIDKPGDYKYMAQLFVKDYFLDPRRGYGANVVDVFKKLRQSKFENIFAPAKEQFDGSGSYGNGGAMRIAPVALYCHKDYNTMIETAKKVTELTHTNPLGVNGALLQCIAIHQALFCDPKEKLDTKLFCEKLIDKIKPFEKDDDGLGIPKSEENIYYSKLRVVQHFLEERYSDEYDDEVIMTLGNSIEAIQSVPTAIFCFLRAHAEIPTVESSNIFRRAIQYAITLGGDTDTIASMTGAIAGAYFGEEKVNPNLLKHCEYSTEIKLLADDLFKSSLKAD